jgi:hypothetical protein
MIGPRRIADCRVVAARVSLCLAFVLLMLVQAATAEEPQRPADDPASQAAPRAFEPGFLHALGRWFEDSVAGMKNATPVLPDLGDRAGEATRGAAVAARDAADAVARLPATRIVTSRQRCEPAGNGAPDCQAAANAACRSKGFGSGRSVDIESAQKCPARVWLSGRPPAEGECVLETFVTRAICQ